MYTNFKKNYLKNIKKEIQKKYYLKIMNISHLCQSKANFEFKINKSLKKLDLIPQKCIA